VISANKKLTHDLIQHAGYGHLLPQQVWFPRVYEEDLAARIAEGLGVGSEDAVVLKLSNRTRAAGVLPVPVISLDMVLHEILTPPSDTEEWFQRKLASGPLAALQVKYGSYEEQVRHWWSNECPFFVAERFCTSMPSHWEGEEYDGTMRVAFALRKKEPPPGAPDQEGAADNGHKASSDASKIPSAEELEVDWLGGYWKLPKAPVDSADFRDSVISAARTGTTPVAESHLREVYCALGQCIQAMFSMDPAVDNLKSWYEDSPPVSSYLIARLASSNKNQNKCLVMMEQAKLEAAKIKEEPMKQCARSFVARAQGVCAFQSTGRVQLPQAKTQFKRSLELNPLNSTTLYLLGMTCLEEQGQDDQQAVNLMARSLLLDPDFKGPYVNLGVAFLRLSRYDDAIRISEAGLGRHPQSPQCHYHIGVACYRKSVILESGPPLAEPMRQHEELRGRALKALQEARASDDAQKVLAKNKHEAPWTAQDDQMVSELETIRSVFLKPRRPGQPPADHGPQVGWRWFQWRV